MKRPEKGLELETIGLAIILNQGCDLEQDWRAIQDLNEKARLSGVLFAPLHDVNDVQVKMGFGTKEMKPLLQNLNERFHYLGEVDLECDSLGEGIPAKIVDFKDIRSIKSEELYASIREKVALRRTRLITPYSENVTRRYTNYFSRIALPN